MLEQRRGERARKRERDGRKQLKELLYKAGCGRGIH